MSQNLTQSELGQRLRQARERIPLSQKDFAQAVGKDQKAIWEYENGSRRISAIELSGFARVLGVPISYFFDGDFIVDELDQVLLNEFHALPPDDKQDVLAIIRILARATKRRSP